MKLPNGITGFYSTSIKLPPKVDGKQFKQLCFTIANESGGKVSAFKEPQYPMNFYDVEVMLLNRHFHILLNKYYPYLAFASAVEFGKIQFIDFPDLKIQFSLFYKVLEAKELNKPVVLKLGHKKDILLNGNELNNGELEQIAYWKPEKIGDIVFNFWD